MGKKINASAAQTSISQDINSDLVKEVAELRKQIEHRLDSLIADREIPDSTDHNVLGHVLSSTLGEATYMAELANAELNAMEMSTLREQDENELELITKGSDVTQNSKKARPEKTRKKNCIFLVSSAVGSLCKSSKLKK